MSKRYNLKNIRILLTEGFTAEELRHFCSSEPTFRPVYDALTRESSKAEIIERLLEYIEQKLQLEPLLAWTKERNLARYEQHQPYYDFSSSPTTLKGDGEFQKVTEITKKITPRGYHTNPFIYGPPVPSEKFIGREREVDIILDRLANFHNRGGSMVSGPWGIGKTSLLHYLYAEDTHTRWIELSPEVAHFIYMPTGLISPFSEIEFWEFLFGELDEWLGPTSGTQKIIESLESGKPPSRINITRFFTKLGEGKENKFVVVLLDGFDLLMGEINKEDSKAGLAFLHTLRALLNLPAPRGFSLITSSQRELYDLFTNVLWFGSGFYSNMANLPLAPFNETQIDALIDSYLIGTGVNFDENDRNHLKKASKGHPQKLQYEAHLLFEKKVNSEGEIRVTTPEQQQFALMVLTQAVSFLFDEARKILVERRERRQKMAEPDDTTALPTNVKESTKETILKLKPTLLNEETQREINHLLELIKIQTNHRRKAEIKINKLGGILFVPPNVRVELESAEDEMLNHTQKLKKLLEKVYNQPIHIDGLE